MIEKGPAGVRFWVCISKTWENLFTDFSPVVVTPLINILPVGSTVQLNSSAERKTNYYQ